MQRVATMTSTARKSQQQHNRARLPDRARRPHRQTKSRETKKPASKSSAAKSIAYWVARIQKTNIKSVAGIIEHGKNLIAAKNSLKQRGLWLRLIDDKLKYDRSYAHRLMRVARDRRLLNSANLPKLPPVLSTLVKLTRLSDKEFKTRLAAGTICREMTAKQALIAQQPNTFEPAKLKPKSNVPKLLLEIQISIDQLIEAIDAGVTIDELAARELMPRLNHLMARLVSAT